MNTDIKKMNSNLCKLSKKANSTGIQNLLLENLSNQMVDS